MADAPHPFDDPLVVPSTDGVELAVYDLGGTGPDVLIVHATGFCAGAYAPLASRLEGHRVAALDVRGHGRSGRGRATMAWEGTAQDVLAAVDALALDRPAGVGHSMGGAALLMAELGRPGTFSALWLYEPIVFPRMGVLPEDGSNPLADGAARRRDTFPSAEAAFANYAGKPPLSELDPDCLAAYVEHGFRTLEDGTVTLRCRPEVEAETFRMGPRHDTFDRLEEVTCPVVVLRGADVPGPASLAPTIAERLPHGSLEAHPELGHFGPLAALDVMAASISDAVGGAA